jgi:hypothetical protein
MELALFMQASWLMKWSLSLDWMKRVDWARSTRSLPTQYTDKKENKIFLVKKEIQMRAVAKS